MKEDSDSDCSSYKKPGTIVLCQKKKETFHTVFRKSLLYSMQDSAPTSITLLVYYKTFELKQHTPTFLEK